MKLISKVLASRLKSVTFSIVNENQVAYVNNRFVIESSRLISDVLKINGGKTTPYFKLERGTRQEDPISAYLFIIALEVVISLIKANPGIEGREFFSYAFLYSVYADNTTFFIRNE